MRDFLLYDTKYTHLFDVGKELTTDHCKNGTHIQLDPNTLI